VGLSLAIVFQLFCVCFAPNRNAYLRARFSGVTDPYTSVAGLASTWSFFAPEPGPPPIYIEYELFDHTGNLLRKSTYPDPQEKLFFSDRVLRRGASTQFLLSHPNYVLAMLVPYFCNLDSNVGSVRLNSVVYGIPSIQEVADGTRSIGDEADLHRKSLGFDFCPDVPKKAAM
jgi:hypothetical protein